MKVFDFERGRFWVGRECLQLQGIDWEDIPGIDAFAESELCDLGGNAFAATSVMVVMLATLASLRFCRPKASASAVDSAWSSSIERVGE